MKHLALLLACMAGSATLCASTSFPADSIAAYPSGEMRTEASDLVRNTKIIYINGDDGTRAPRDSAEKLISTFYEDQYRQFYDPHAPYFMFMTKTANLALGIGGRVILRGWYDWNGTQDSHEFYPYDIAVPRDPANSRGIGASPAQTSIFMTLLGHNRQLGNYMVYVQAGVKDKALRLKKAYVSLSDWTIGYAGTTFADDDALAATVDAEGPNGQVSKSAMLVRYLHKFKSGWTVAAGLEFPASDITTDDETKKCHDFVPDIVAQGQYAWDGGDSHVRLSGLLRVMSYRDLVQKRNHSVVGWGAMLSGRWQLYSPLSFYYQGVVGSGIGSYLGDLSEGAYDLVPDGADKGRLTAPLALGVSLGLQYDFSKKVFASLALGECRYFNRHAPSDDYKYGLYGAANVFWNITPRIQTGAEYILGKRTDFSGQHAWQDRVDVLLSFSF